MYKFVTQINDLIELTVNKRYRPPICDILSLFRGQYGYDKIDEVRPFAFEEGESWLKNGFFSPYFDKEWEYYKR